MKIEELLFENLKKAMAEFSKVAGPEKAKSTIEKFTELKNRNQFKDPIERDINHWRERGWEEFSQMIDKKSKVASDTQIKRGKIVGNAIMLRDDAEWKVLIPLDKEASVFYGKGTKWCTTRPYDSYYERYVYEDNGTLIYAIDQVGNGKRSVAILIKKNGEIDMFNKQDKPIDATRYTEISGLDSNNYIKIAKSPENIKQLEDARKIYNTAKEETKRLLQVTPLDSNALEASLKITKNREDCYNFIKKYGTEQNNRVNVHPIILAAAAAHVSEQGPYKSNHWAADLGKYVDFSKIPNATMKSVLRMSPELFIYNIDLLSNEQKSLLTSSPKSAYLYVVKIRNGERFPAVEPVIAQDAKSASAYAVNVLKYSKSASGEFPAGEAAIATDADASYDYAFYVLKKRFPAGESAIAGDPRVAVDYVENILHRPMPEAELEIVETEYLAKRYGQALNGNTSPSWERLIKDNLDLIIAYVIGVKKNVPALEPKLAEDSYHAFKYATILNKRFPAGEPAIGQVDSYAYEYAKDIIGGPFPEGEEAIMKSKYADLYEKMISTPTKRKAPATSEWKPPKDVANQLLSGNQAAATKYWYDDRETLKGPVSREQLLDLVKRRVISGNTYVWRKGLNEWVFLSQLKKELIEEEEIYHYVINDAKLGPVTKTYLHKLLTGNMINSHTLVWRPGMKGWQEISALMKEITPVKTEGKYTQRRNINAYNIRR